MAGITGYLQNTAGVTVIPGTPKHLLNAGAPANQRALIKEIHVQMMQATGAAPTNETAKVEICRNSTSGAGTTCNPIKADVSADETLQVTGIEALTTEPTVTTVIMAEEIMPLMGGRFDWVAPRREDMIVVKGGQYCGIRITPDYATTTRSYYSRIVYEE